jgi:three-Cys-motif partner protein
MANRTENWVHRFGGDWTTAKLSVVSDYLSAYTNALKRQPFKTGYIDAFAGTGYRAPPAQDEAPLFEDFPDFAAPEESLLDGSARLALKAVPPFNRYVFIERSKERCEALELLKTEFPEKAKQIDVKQGDANPVIQSMCEKDWSKHRAVLFLDPYGMQVEWETIVAVAGTKAIDLWVLFPLGIGVNRLLTRSGEIPAGWRNRLNLLLGTEDWFDEFYRVEATTSLFGDPMVERVKKATTETIGKYFNERLRSVFADVAPEPKVLSNSQGNPLYLLCFAAGNPKGAPVAMKIAKHLLRRTA